MDLAEGTPPALDSNRGSDVTIREPGRVGILWRKHTAAPRGKAKSFAVVKAVEPGSSAANAGVRPFQVLMSINGMTVAPLEYRTVIDQIRETRPLRLTFAPLERAWLRAEVLFAAPGALGLKLEPATGDPRADGVKLKKVLPSSAHANSVELSAGMDLVAMRVGLGQPIQLNNMPYGACVAKLKSAARPLTLFFDPGEAQVATQSIAGGNPTSPRTASATPTWSRTSEEAVRQALKRCGREPRLSPRVCEAFSNAGYPPASWAHELEAMNQQDELESFMTSVNAIDSTGVAQETLVKYAGVNRVPVAAPAAVSTVESIGAPMGEFQARAMAAIAAEENFKALTLLESHTEEVLSRLLDVTQTELERIRHEAAARQSASSETLAIWQGRVERAETAEAAAHEAVAVAIADTRQRGTTPSRGSPDISALQEKCEALQLRVDYYESRLREKEESHQAELHMRDILLRATELELERAHSGTLNADCQDVSSISDTGSQQQMRRPEQQLELPHEMQIDTGTSAHAVHSIAAVVDDPGSTEVVPVVSWPSFFKLELERLSEDQRHREAQIRKEALAKVAEERAIVEAKHASYEDVVDSAYAQVLDVFNMPKFDQTESY